MLATIAKQGRLAAAARADDGDDLAVGDREVDIAYRLDRLGPLAEAFRYLPDRDHRGCAMLTGRSRTDFSR